MKRENLPSRARKELQRGTVSNGSHDTFAAQPQAADGDGLFKYVVLYALTLLLQPLLAVVLTLAALLGLWQLVWWVLSS